jgi:tetratricopeptide (TPR) repeat protein
MARQPSTAPITFLVPGQSQATRGAAAASIPGLPGRVKENVRMAARRAGSEPLRVTAVPGEDVVVLQIAGGPPLLLHPENARDLLLGPGSAKRGAVAASGDVAVPVQLRWQGLEQAAPTRTRGFLGDVVLSAFQVLTGFAKDSAVTLATSAVLKRLDGQVEAGVYALRPEALKPLKGSGLKLDKVPPSNEPMLVLVHGTFVETVSTFGKLWALYPQRVRTLFTAYGGRVYALDHPTLGASPIANALTLVQALPQGARLHLATHSRGGLVAEVLARVAAQPRLTADDLAFFAGAGLAGQRAELQALSKAVVEQGITVERIVRVACPARGTLLASKRLDAYLSVLKWSLELTGVPALPEVVDFLAEVARRRADPAEIPGLAAMIPGAPLVNWLNAAEEPIAGDLRVVAGDLQGDSVTSWLKTLLADAYYWTDNDIVVQTRSMYGGAPRAGGASFLLDQGGRVTHFNYFANERTVAAVVDGLTQAQPAGFRLIGPLSWAGQDSGGVRAARRARAAAGPAGDRPAVFVLPGILGSNLAAEGKRIWLSLRLIGGLSKLRYRPGVDDKVTPDGAVSLVYDDLIEYLEATHEVIEFAFDWRRPIEDEARRLADAVELALESRKASGQPVRLLAHSMGGVLARTMQLERPATWQRLMSHAGARLLMLGTPNGGSWAPMQVLSGDDTFGNALAGFGSPLRDRQARQMMAEMPGFIQLQADLLDPQRGLGQEATWRKLADDDLRTVQEANWWHRSAGEAMQDAYVWGVPPQAVLDRAKALRERLDRQCRDDLPAFADKLLLVVGRARFTPDGFEWTDQGLVYLDATDGGDGRVPLASALLPGVRTWTLDCEHGSLPDARRAFPAFVELLAQGETRQLQPLAAAGARSGAATPAVPHVRSRPSRGQLSALPAQNLRSVFDSDRRPEGFAPDAPQRGAALQVTVLNGNLAFIRQPLLVGHYRTSVLTGTEGVVNRLVGGAMQAALDAGLYPDEVGTHQIFVNTWRSPDNPWRPPRPQSVVVVGLGDEGTLTEMRLRDSVRQATIAWAQRVAEDPEQGGAEIKFASTLLGSGGMGISPSATARAIAQGVREANDRLAGSGWPLVSRLTLVELYLDRAAEAWRGLQVLVTASPDRFGLAPTIASGSGPLRWQSDSGYRGADHDFITATAGAVPGSIEFTLDTRRARTEIRSQRMQGKLLRDLVARASTDINDDPTIGRTLFQLLVPLEVEPFLGGTQRMLLELDDSTAPIPWELLETPDDGRGHADPRPWAIRSQLLRKLRKTSYRAAPRDAQADDAVLVIGQPAVDAKKYGPLPGALAEAKAVVARFTAPGGLAADRVTALVDDDDAARVIGALLARRYRIVHVAGHGEAGEAGGVVLSGGTFLGPREIETMRTVPELVFVNCCHLAGRSADQTLAPPLDRSAFAAGVADKLIEIGVRCVVAAGWAVEDGPAETFATTFYRELLAGATFIDAVAAAREAAWADNPGGKTWAAYQCYGDPGWTFRSSVGDAQAVRQPAGDDQDHIASALGLALALEEAAVRARWASTQAEDESQQQRQAQLQKIRRLEARFATLWGGMGAVAEAYAVAYAEAGDFIAAIAWYERAVHADDSSASLKACEQFENLRARQAWQTVAEGQPTKAALAAARKGIVHAIERLRSLADRHATVERCSLIGSACKRLAMLEQRAGDAAAARAALDAAAGAYGQAEVLATNAGSSELFYPALNRMALELVVHGGEKGWPGLDAARTLAVRRSLEQRTQTDPDIWSYIGQIEVELYEALAAGRLATSQASLAEGYANIHARLGAARVWRTVADQARFVLEPVLARTQGKEHEAARALLDRLIDYARGGAGR